MEERGNNIFQGSLIILKAPILSLQIVQKRKVGTIFHTAALLGLPADHQHANKSITRLGITQDIPKWLKRTLHKAKIWCSATKDQNIVSKQKMRGTPLTTAEIIRLSQK
jgi:hypothetical protein